MGKYIFCAALDVRNCIRQRQLQHGRQMALQLTPDDSHKLPERQTARVRKRLHQDQQGHFLALFGQAPGHFKRDQTTQRVSDQQIGAARLQLLDGIEGKMSRILDAIAGLLHAIGSPRLYPIDRMIDLELANQREELHDATAQSMSQKQGRPLAAWLEQYEWGKSRGPGLVQ